MRRLLSILLIALSAIALTAQNKTTYSIKLKATSGLTSQELPAHFYFLTPDSTVVDSIWTSHYVYDRVGDGVKSYYFFETVTNFKSTPGAEHILKVVADGYETEYRSFTLPTGKVTKMDMTDIKLYPVPSVIELGEVTVKHSRVKMVMKGDTIVFDAAKFQLAHGDMLSEMIKQMEGLTIKDGVIYMNGRKVDDLLVNGESFFKGDASVALNNLPAFTVKNVKFYEKAPESTYITGELPGEEKDYVLDVSLKREYLSGVMGNIEGGWGSTGRYIGRGFGLGFGQKFRLATYFNANNIQNVQTATAASSGDWNSRGTGSGGGAGIADRQLAGIDYQYTANKEVKVNGDANFQHNTQTIKNIISTKNFLDDGNTFSRQINNIDPRELRFSTNHKLQMTKKKAFVEITTGLDYNHFNTERLIRNALYTVEPSETSLGEAVDSVFSRSPQSRWLEGLLYKLSNRNLSRTDGLNFRLNGNSEIKLDENSADFMTVAAFVKFNRQNDASRQDYALTYTDPSTPDNIFNRYTRSNPHTWEYEFCVAYDWKTAPNRFDGVWSLRPYVSFNNKIETKDDRLYNLDPADFEGMGLTIAQQQALQTAIDRQNSYWSSQHDKTGMARVDLGYALSGNKFTVKMQGGSKLANSTLNYDKPDFHQYADRTDWLPFASLRSALRIHNRERMSQQVVFLDLNYRQSTPDLVYQIDSRNTTDPLNILLPNPSLRRPSTTEAVLNYSGRFSEKSPGIYMYGNANFYHNRMTMARIYNPSTGVTIRQPMNVNGSNEIMGYIHISKDLFAGISASLSMQTVFNRYVELFSEGGPLQRNIIHERTLDPGFALSMSPGTFDISTGYNYQMSTTSSTGQYQAATDYGCHDIYGSVRYTTPWKMIVNTAMSASLYHGSSNQSMNQKSAVWTLRVSQPFYKDKWIVTLSASDMLNKRRNIWNTATGSEVSQQWQMSLPRYYMVTLAYRLNYSPRK